MPLFPLSFEQHVRPVVDRRWLIRNTSMSSSTVIFSLPVFLLLLVIGTLSGCGAGRVNLSDSIVKPKSAIIVVPGYYGTRLVRSSDQQLVWISASEALFGNQPLTLPVQGLQLVNAIDLRPDSILDRVQVVPYVYAIDVYGSLIETLRSETHGDTDVISFTYDWRRDLMDSVRRLDVMIQQLRAKGIDEISVVAHSLGGLIVSYYLRYGTQEIASAVETWEGAGNIRTVIMAGVPFLGVMNSLRNMNFGVSVKFNTSMLTSEAYSSFPSSYYTLPLLATDRLLSPTLESLNHMIRNPDNWKQSGWGLRNNSQDLPAEIITRRDEYMSYWLRRSQQFLELLRAPLTAATPHAPRLLYIYAKGTPTLANGIWIRKNRQGQESLYFNNGNQEKLPVMIDPTLLYDDGDETVTVSSASLPAPFLETFLPTVRAYEVTHTELVTNSQILRDIVSFLEIP